MASPHISSFLHGTPLSLGVSVWLKKGVFFHFCQIPTNSSIISNCNWSRRCHFFYFHLPALSYFCTAHSRDVWAPTPGANDIANKLFLAFRFGNTEVIVQFFKDGLLLRSSIVCCKRRSKMSLCVDSNRNQFLRQNGELHISPQPLHFCGDLQMQKPGAVHEIHCHRRQHGMEFR